MTEAEFARQLSELAQVAATLNRETNNINGLLERAEEQIRALHVGIATFVPLSNHYGRELGWSFRTAVVDGKERRQWQLMLLVDTSEERELKELAAASRDERIAALETLPSLIEKLKAEAMQRLEAIRKGRELLGDADASSPKLQIVDRPKGLSALDHVPPVPRGRLPGR
jgi:hypothetical protein